MNELATLTCEGMGTTFLFYKVSPYEQFLWERLPS
jgi:hypothetical protein